jgi:hypothetical protein
MARKKVTREKAPENVSPASSGSSALAKPPDFSKFLKALVPQRELSQINAFSLQLAINAFPELTTTSSADWKNI